MSQYGWSDPFNLFFFNIIIERIFVVNEINGVLDCQKGRVNSG